MSKAKEWARRLTGREYTQEISRAEDGQAKADDVLIIFGASDDLMEFRGAYHDEVGAWEGITVKLTPVPGVFFKDNNSETFEYNSVQISAMPTVTAVWCPEVDGKTVASWEIRTELPHETFDIMEDGELYCRGIVIDAEDIRRSAELQMI